MPTVMPVPVVRPSPLYKQQGLPSSYSPPSRTMSEDEFYLHSLLRYYQQEVIPGYVCPIQWDVRDPPETARRVVSLEDVIGPFHLSRPATSPPMIVLHITCDIFPEAWPIEIRKLDTITINDVLHAIHSSLQRPIRRDEWERLSEKQHTRIEAVFDTRCKNAPNRDECRSRGVLRVDCLLQHTVYAGLSVSPDADCSCFLTLRRPHQAGVSTTPP
ncbi:ectomycorrhiza-regulated small secreted protein [Crepidotus variabilis]|uniref:Ectomycorrhiza-regulated small secreted protein n=1 Tax=Crepidotus variabilis TaxID=179855 RepID=A0A9P6JLT9_9AGAR|nr:ectomycorrhiza-regulated small secreted protein [Crepidotus variabilis]